jgi:hypothetical protein
MDEIEKLPRARKPRKNIRIALVRHVPVSPDELHRQLTALFDVLGMEEELFDSPRPSHTMRVKQ